MTTFYDEAEMRAEREKRYKLQAFLRSIGAIEEYPNRWRWDALIASGTKEIQDERDEARKGLDAMASEAKRAIQQRDQAREDLERSMSTFRDIVMARDAAEGVLIDSGWSKEPSGPWTPPAMSISSPSARATVSRVLDPVTPAKINARMIAFPVLDAIALLAVIDRRSTPFAEGTKAAEALGELEQAVESWLDARAGGV